MRAQDYYQLVVEHTTSRPSDRSLGAHEILIAAVGGIAGLAIASGLRKHRMETRAKEGLHDDIGVWVRVRDRVGLVVFEQRWDSVGNAMLLYEKMKRDLLEMDVEQFRDTYDLTDDETPPPESDPWEGVTWSDDGAT